MANKRIAMTDEERAERRKQEQQLTEQAVAQLRCSAGWQRWLTVRARVGLRRYSVRNQLLIALQDPRATHVAGFRAWLRLGYCVKRGESSHIRVWAPCPPSKKKLDGVARRRRDRGGSPADVLPTRGGVQRHAGRGAAAAGRAGAAGSAVRRGAGRQPGVGDRAAAAARRRARLRRRLRAAASRATAARVTRRPSA